MTHFVEGSKVRTGNVRSVASQYRNAEGVVTHTSRGWIFVTFPDGSEHKFYENELTEIRDSRPTPDEVWMKPASRRFTKSLELRAKYKAVSDTSEFRPIPNFRWNGQTWAHNGKIGTEIKTGKPTAQYNSVEKQGSRCWRNIDGVITSDD